jgi:hypothetical protein
LIHLQNNINLNSNLINSISIFEILTKYCSNLCKMDELKKGFEKLLILSQARCADVKSEIRCIKFARNSLACLRL